MALYSAVRTAVPDVLQLCVCLCQKLSRVSNNKIKNSKIKNCEYKNNISSNTHAHDPASQWRGFRLLAVHTPSCVHFICGARDGVVHRALLINNAFKDCFDNEVERFTSTLSIIDHHTCSGVVCARQTQARVSVLHVHLCASAGCHPLASPGCGDLATTRSRWPGSAVHST